MPAPHDHAGVPVTEHADECGSADKARKSEKGPDRLGLFHAVYLAPKPAQVSSTAGLAETVARKAFDASQPEKGPTVIREDPFFLQISRSRLPAPARSRADLSPRARSAESLASEEEPLAIQRAAPRTIELGGNSVLDW